MKSRIERYAAVDLRVEELEARIEKLEKELAKRKSRKSSVDLPSADPSTKEFE